jgi:hypothetical protein
MAIDFSINNRVVEMLAQMEHLPGNAAMPGYRGVLADIAKQLDKPFTLADFQKHIDDPAYPPIEYSVFDGPAVYALIHTHHHLRFYPAIVWIGQAEHMRRRIRQHEKAQERGEIFFDSVRGVFIENARIRRLVEKDLIGYFSDPENSPHAESLANKRGRKFARV